ncbi:hypothetical protein V1264_010781 [Littorina saxatilis]|uniref:Uncharacterized protein n=1 Tax=Littorina saxatilis TaxID=31220 RepID=A0AAN9G186_9CAEN
MMPGVCTMEMSVAVDRAQASCRQAVRGQKTALQSMNDYVLVGVKLDAENVSTLEGRRHWKGDDTGRETTLEGRRQCQRLKRLSGSGSPVSVEDLNCTFFALYSSQ